MNDPRSPRDWLLARREPVVPRLDAIRHAALLRPGLTWRDFLRDLFHPHRTAWSALAAVWIVLALFHFMTRRPQEPSLVNPPPPEAIAAWFAQLRSNETFAQIDRHP